jgi:hypothetical protein
MQELNKRKCQVCFVFGATAPSGPGPHHSRGFLIKHTTTHHSPAGQQSVNRTAQHVPNCCIYTAYLLMMGYKYAWNMYRLITYLLTPWSRVLLEKLTVNFAASQEIPRIYGTRKFHTVPTSGRHLSLSWANSISMEHLTYLLTYLLTYSLTYLLHGAESFLRS